MPAGVNTPSVTYPRRLFPDAQTLEFRVPPDPAASRLTAFLYLLLRDDAPAGRLIEIAQEVKGVDQFRFTNPHLAALAADLAGRLAPHATECGCGKPATLCTPCSLVER